MAALRLSLAEIRHKEEQLDASIAQFRTQLRRLPRQTIYGRAPLDMALSAMERSKSGCGTPRTTIGAC